MWAGLFFFQSESARSFGKVSCLLTTQQSLTSVWGWWHVHKILHFCLVKLIIQLLTMRPNTCLLRKLTSSITRVCVLYTTCCTVPLRLTSALLTMYKNGFLESVNWFRIGEHKSIFSNVHQFWISYSMLLLKTQNVIFTFLLMYALNKWDTCKLMSFSGFLGRFIYFFGQIHGSCFPVLPVFMLSYTKHVLNPAAYVKE